MSKPQKTLLVGASGFVGSNLASQFRFSALATSKNIADFAGQRFDLAVVAAGDARKWFANQNPELDLQHMQRLTNDVCAIQCDRVVHFSTVDVYGHKAGDENSLAGHVSTDAYGGHRYVFEEALKRRFNQVTTLRLPGLFGRGLKKNLIFDMSQNRSLAAFHPQSTFQWFDLAEMPRLLAWVSRQDIEVLNVASEPVSVHELLSHLGAPTADLSPNAHVVSYDIRSRHAAAFGGRDGYLYSKQQSLESVGRFLLQLAGGKQ